MKNIVTKNNDPKSWDFSKIGNRIRYIRKYSFKISSRQKFGAFLGVEWRKVRNWETGKTKPKQAIIELILQKWDELLGNENIEVIPPIYDCYANLKPFTVSLQNEWVDFRPDWLISGNGAISFDDYEVISSKHAISIQCGGRDLRYQWDISNDLRDDILNSLIRFNGKYYKCDPAIYNLFTANISSLIDNFINLSTIISEDEAIKMGCI